MPVVKGGVWTNIEDEVLKAAIAKYGLNQWARVSSLLARKTPKQCKARWSEWLDPGIRKVEWSRDEDERLLHLAKLMPTQWRTIAPIVGRTATQCLDRYQKLLDEAETREAAGAGADDLALGGPAGGEAAAPSADDVRRLRPGELDPDPESKPARPDTIDMDEDEKEMLSEARARLANTQGKKAKRKARERQLEESRRLALLQKRRELKNAGINTKITYRKKGQMDYNADIPFEKQPAAGFFDTTDEIERNERQREAFDPKKQQVANKRKPDDDDEQDRKRKKTSDGKQENPSAAAMRAAQLQKIREAERSTTRRALKLPAPQVGEGELEEIIKMGVTGDRAARLAGDGDNAATRGIVGNYSAVQQTPIRTPRAAPEEDRVANELKNIRALTEAQSSLLGGENAELYEGSGSTGFEGATPRKQALVTPNPMATPLRQGAGAGPGQTPGGPGATPMRTPRDTFRLNQAQDMALASTTPRDVHLRERALRDELKGKLAALPKPKESEWELELPEEQREPSRSEGVEEDATERDRRLAAIEAARQAAEFRRRTRVMQKGLPRPSVLDVKSLYEVAASAEGPAQRLVEEEMAGLMVNDLHKFPLPGAKLSGAARVLQELTEDDLNRARLELILELPSDEMDKRVTEMSEAWASYDKKSLLPGLAACDGDEEADAVVAVKERQLIEETFDGLQERAMELAQRNNAVEKKLGLHLGGYKKRAELLRQKMVEADEALRKAEVNLDTIATLQVVEGGAIASRLERLRDEVAFVARREREAQEDYRLKREELEALAVAQSNGVH